MGSANFTDMTVLSRHPKVESIERNGVTFGGAGTQIERRKYSGIGRAQLGQRAAARLYHPEVLAVESDAGRRISHHHVSRQRGGIPAQHTNLDRTQPQARTALSTRRA